MVDDEVGTTLVGHDASERGLDLLGDAEIVEYGEVARVELDHLFAVGSNQGDVVVYLAEDVFIVHIDRFVGRVEEVAQHGYGAAGLFEDEQGRFVGTLNLANDFLPAVHEDIQLGVEFCDALAFAGRAHDDAEILRFDALEELFESRPFFGRLDFC